MTAIVTVMTHYPSDVLNKLVHPLHGLPGRQNNMPSPYDVRKFCDAEMPRPWGREHIRAQAQRAEDAAAKSTPRQTLAEIEDEMLGRGVYMRGALERELRRRVISWRELERETQKRKEQK